MLFCDALHIHKVNQQQINEAASHFSKLIDYLVMVELEPEPVPVPVPVQKVEKVEVGI